MSPHVARTVNGKAQHKAVRVAEVESSSKEHAFIVESFRHADVALTRWLIQHDPDYLIGYNAATKHNQFRRFNLDGTDNTERTQPKGKKKKEL